MTRHRKQESYNQRDPGANVSFFEALLGGGGGERRVIGDVVVGDADLGAGLESLIVPETPAAAATAAASAATAASASRHREGPGTGC